MLSDEEKEALRNFKSEYETCDHYSSDLIIELDDAEILLNLIDKQSKEIEGLKEDNKKKSIVIIEYQDLYEKLVDKIKAKIEEKFLEAKGLYERGVQPQAQYTMKLLRDLEKSLLEKE